MIRRALAVVALVVGGAGVSSADDEPPCWLSGDVSSSITTQEAILRTYLLAIHLDDPDGDLEVRLAHGDYRLVGIGPGFPPLSKLREGHILCTFGGRSLVGTGDAFDGSAHAKLISRFESYAVRYNSLLIERYATMGASSPLKKSPRNSADQSQRSADP